MELKSWGFFWVLFSHRISLFMISISSFTYGLETYAENKSEVNFLWCLIIWFLPKTPFLSQKTSFMLKLCRFTYQEVFIDCTYMGQNWLKNKVYCGGSQKPEVKWVFSQFTLQRTTLPLFSYYLQNPSSNKVNKSSFK